MSKHNAQVINQSFPHGRKIHLAYENYVCVCEHLHFYDVCTFRCSVFSHYMLIYVSKCKSEILLDYMVLKKMIASSLSKQTVEKQVL